MTALPPIRISSLAQDDIDAIVDQAAKTTGEDPALVRQVLTISSALDAAAAAQVLVMRDRLSRLSASTDAAGAKT